MSARFSGPRRRSLIQIKPSLERKLLAYAAAGGAAYAAAIVGAIPAQAEVVYTQAHIVMTLNSSGMLDINGDGINDFVYQEQSVFQCGRSCQTTYFFNWVDFQAAQAGNGVVEGPKVINWVCFAHLQAKKTVGDGRQFISTGSASFQDDECLGWKPPARGYVGLRFTIDGDTHYGWLRLIVTPSSTQKAETVTITGYAYETEPNTPIVIDQRPGDDVISSGPSEPASLGVLAAGASGLNVWRPAGGPDHP